MDGLTVNLEFNNCDELTALLKKAQSDAEVLKADIEAVKNFNINVSQN